MKFSKKQLSAYLVSYLFSIFTMASHAESILLTAAGRTLIDTKNHGFPLLIISKDNGNNWLDKTPRGDQAKKDGFFKSTTCTGKSGIDVCVAIGKHLEGENFEKESPLLAVSTDGGNNWTFKNISELTNGSLNASSCIKYGSDIRCMAVGREKLSKINYAALFAISNDNGNTWTTKKITTLPEGVHEIDRISCSGNDITAICSMIGYDSKNHRPALMTSSNGGNTWVNHVLVNYDYIYRDTSCTGNGSNGICMVVGDSNIDSIPFLAVSSDGTQTWVEKTVKNMPRIGSLYSSTCTGNESSAICAGFGREVTSSYPILVFSTDGGNNWTAKTIKNNTDYGSQYSISCTGSGATAVCAAAATGYEYPGSFPLILITSTGGHTWVTKKIFGLSARGYINSSSCSGSGSSAICIGVGYELSNGMTRPLLIMSTNGGNTWDLKDMSKISENGNLSVVNLNNS